MIKKTYHISGFDCPNCAHKSEVHLGKHEKVDSCHIDFSTNKMYVTYKEEEFPLVKKMVMYLVNYFRYIVNLRVDFVELSQEFRHVENYLKMGHRTRKHWSREALLGLCGIVTYRCSLDRSQHRISFYS